MSALITLATYNGIVMGADSRVTYDGIFIDNANKIFLTENKIAIGITRNFSRGNINTETVLNEIIQNELNKEYYDIHKTAHYIIDLWCNDINLKYFKNYIIVAGYDEQKVPIIYQITTNLGMNGQAEWTFISGYECCSSNADDAVKSYMDEQFKEHCNGGEIAFIGKDEGVRLCRKWISETASISQSIGGHGDMLVIEPNEVHWEYRR